MPQSAKRQQQKLITSLQPGDVRPRPPAKRSQAHPGVSPLHPVSHRNVSFQPLPRPLGLAPYHYDLAANFPDIANDIEARSRLIFHVVGDTGGVQDGEFQNNVAENIRADALRGRSRLCLAAAKSAVAATVKRRTSAIGAGFLAGKTALPTGSNAGRRAISLLQQDIGSAA